MHVRTTANFSREVEGDIQHIPGHFTSHPQHVSKGCDFDFHQLLKELNLAVHNFNARGSNFVLDVVTQFVVVITQFRPLGGSTYIPTRPALPRNKPSSIFRIMITAVSNGPFCRVCTQLKAILFPFTVTVSIETS